MKKLLIIIHIHSLTGGKICHKAEKNIDKCKNIVYLEFEGDDKKSGTLKCCRHGDRTCRLGKKTSNGGSAWQWFDGDDDNDLDVL